MLSNLKTSTSTQFVAHSALSVFVGALVYGLTVVGQNAFTPQGANLHTALGLGLTAFAAWFTHGFISLAGTSQAKQAGVDEFNALKEAVDGLTTSHTQLATLVQQIGEAALASQAAPTQDAAPAPAPNIPFQETSTMPWLAAIPKQA